MFFKKDKKEKDFGFVSAEAFRAEKKSETIVTLTPEEQHPVKWAEVKGYKAVSKDLKAFHGDYTYKVDEPNVHIGKIEICKSGLHFCPNLKDLSYYADILESRIFEVTAVVDVNYPKREDKWHCFDSNKLVAKSITFVRELSTDEIYEAFKIALRDDIYYGMISTKADFEEFRFQSKNLLSVAQKKTEAKLVSVGYSETFTKIIMESIVYLDTLETSTGWKRKVIRFDKKLADLAIAYGEEGLSPDMRAYLLSKKMR